MENINDNQNIKYNSNTCPKCGHLNFWYKFINGKEIELCSKCGYWDNHKLDEVELFGVQDKDINKNDKIKI